MNKTQTGIQKITYQVLAFVMSALILLTGCGTMSSVTIPSEETSSDKASSDKISSNESSSGKMSSDEDASDKMSSIEDASDKTSSGQKSSHKDKADFSSFTLDCFKEYVSKDSLTLHFTLADPEKYGISQDEVAFQDISSEGQKRDCTRAKALLKELKSFDSSKLSQKDKLTCDIFKKKLEQDAQAEDYIYYNSYLGNSGLPSEISVSLSEYYFDDEEDIEDYFGLLRQVPSLFDSLLKYQKERQEAGFSTPSFAVDHTIDQIDSLLSVNSEDQLLVSSFIDRLKNLEDLNEDQKDAYIAQNQTLLEEKVIPAYESLKEALESWEISKEGDYGLSHLKKGKDYYKLLLQVRVGSDKTPEQLIPFLEDKLKDHLAELNTINASNEDLYLDFLTATPVLSDFDDILDCLKKGIRDDFPEIKEIPYTIMDFPDAMSGTNMAAFYLVPPIDSPDSGIVFVNNDHIDKHALFPTLAHETFPGHLYQHNYFRADDPDPLRCLLKFEGYDEGWGTYTELYSYNLLEFSNVDKETQNVLRQLYQDNDLVSLTLSSLSDLYVNYKNYDKEELADYLADFGIAEEAAYAIYENVVENPVTYLTYCVGYYEFKELLEKYQDQAEEDFDIKTFHKKVLDCGPCPFDILEKQVLDLSHWTYRTGLIP